MTLLRSLYTPLAVAWYGLVVAVALSFQVQAKESALSAKDYGALPQNSMLAVSPSGERLAYRTTGSKGEDYAVVISLVDGQQLNAIDLSNITPERMYFANENEVIVVASTVRKLFGYRGKMDLSTAYAFNWRSGDIRQMLTPGDVIYTGQSGLGRVIGLSPDNKYAYMPAYVPKDQYDNNPRFSLVRVDFEKPKRPKVHFKGRTSSRDFFVDESGEVIAHELFDNKNNVHRLMARRGDEWEEVYRKETEIPVVSFTGLSPDRQAIIFLATAKGRDRKNFYALSLATGEVVDLGFGRDDADVERTYKTLDRRVWGLRYSGLTPSYHFFDESISQRMEDIQSYFEGHSVWLRDWSDGWEHLMVYVEGTNSSGEYYLFPKEGAPMRLFAARPNIKSAQVHPIATINFKARDGLMIPTLLTLPKSKVDDLKSLPAVIMPHGGPASYDRVGFDWLAQALANRGYLVVQPQFRGSTGFGHAHYQAGQGEWGKKMQDDLSDAVDMLVRKGIVDAERVCIAGMSYGGYAALAGGAFTPEKYRCVVSVNGVSDLEQMLRTEKRDHGRHHWVVAYWEKLMADGDADKDTLRAVSPSRHSEQFQAPVLLIHGEDDVIVPLKQSRDMYKRLKREKKPVEFVELEDETHNLETPEGRMQTVEKIVAFVDKHLQP
ncbi:alpha/beta hydrolase family protein [Microbulbifer agarilyticus]|uniref:alpha/beta hydrolase family protein n=1 Tax=Microbulbifer agarilyticus TaxID=260552 RepID=UPI001CD78FCE|nr:prolyl oligopeptidase family serine peptidase [Microbulbifer agarilyticus]MCA0902035.1 alpha/beta fold hydrolase [Microbulbifer agarilyticus]